MTGSGAGSGMRFISPHGPGRAGAAQYRRVGACRWLGSEPGDDGTVVSIGTAIVMTVYPEQADGAGSG
ncbi:MAG TPA: hypothetical protein VKC66_03830 [Xanthobacteraceae bacterium]|nr:hypothetical protein [Xanthobacteraceae bacterium]